jgi:nitrate/TMAO reductase-like tetraheme cytochrome c subunit
METDMKTALLIFTSLISFPVLASSQGQKIVHGYDYKAECGSCHVAFPPRLLGKSDWATIMRDLDKHFGTDASLDPKTTISISRWLQQHAGSRGKSDTSLPRITTTSWFKKEHREVPAYSWQDPRIKTPANCAACHKGAEQGLYREADIAIPGQGRRYGDE